MAEARFFAHDLREGRLRLPDPEAAHARKSRRLTTGDEVVLFDGQGQEAAARVLAATRAGVEVMVERISRCRRPEPSLTLGVALPKGPRQDVLIEKCTELGVAAVWPIVTARSISSASEHKLDKWRRTSIEAAKQSGQNWLPELGQPAGLADVAGRISGFDRVFVATRDAAGFPGCHGCRGVLAFVGPEGGWTGEELALLTQAGAEPISLGPNTLRIETAAIALAALVHAASR
jgi:16S rRNA (uracil1498-N3)-methyltransferase